VAKERMEQELQKAREIQEHLLPAQGPPIPDNEVYGHSAPCQAVAATISITWSCPAALRHRAGDVAGRGVAALLMASFQASLHALCEMGCRRTRRITRLTGT